MKSAFDQLNEQIVACEQCPRLRDWCEQVAREKRRAFADDIYWGRPVPNFGDPAARLLIVGLAPAAHGANRTGRMFTGDRSGDFLYAALWRAGFANRAEATDRDDGLELIDAAITAACHCAPPANKPTAEELSLCENWFSQTFALLPVQAVLALGQIGWKSIFKLAKTNNWSVCEGEKKFGHGCRVGFDNGIRVFGSYHPSQQNTFTGRLTESMLDEVLLTVRQYLAEC